MRRVAFPKDVLSLLDRTSEVDIETRSSQGSVHRVPIWIVVAGDDVYARSWRGSQARWYRELTAREGGETAAVKSWRFSVPRDLC